MVRAESRLGVTQAMGRSSSSAAFAWHSGGRTRPSRGVGFGSLTSQARTAPEYNPDNAWKRHMISSLATKQQRLPLCRQRTFASASRVLNARANGNDDGSKEASTNKDTKAVDETAVPLVFLHGMKGSHLAVSNPSEGSTNGQKQDTPASQRSWLTLGGLLNFPPREDGHPDRDISLPLSYQKTDASSLSSYPIQDRGRHFVDGTVDHVVELGSLLPGGAAASLPNTGNLDFFPFYGHATKYLEEVNEAYANGMASSAETLKGNQNGDTKDDASSRIAMDPRPTRTFCYDWRRNLFELTEEFHAFCESEFPGEPVQVVAHSMGGLLAYAVMKEHPAKYRPGGVLVGVPFGTGIQYFQDVHKGYFTELGTCRQFLPPAQFTFSSHWSFFPVDRDEIGDSFVDVSEYFDDNGGDGEGSIAFEADRSTIGKKSTETDEDKWRPATPGTPIEIDFYDPEEWEANEIGIFDPSYRKHINSDQLAAYKRHMEVQMKDAKRWRTTVLAPWKDEETARKQMPPLTICSSVSVPTPNQILRRKRVSAAAAAATALDGSAAGKAKIYEKVPRSLISLLEQGGDGSTDVLCQWEYDYASGRTVPGDGRIDYDKSFPPIGTSFSTVDLHSLHAKQFCWEETGGNLSTIWEQVNQQLADYRSSRRKQRGAKETKETDKKTSFSSQAETEKVSTK